MSDTEDILPNAVAPSRIEMSEIKAARTEKPRTPPIYDRHNYNNGASLFNPVMKTLGVENLANSVETVYFRDGKRRIDYVLAYEEGDPSSNLMDERRALKRQIFVENVLKTGVHIEIEDKEQSQDGKTFFVKLHATWEVLAGNAEIMNMKMPIKELDEEEERESKDPCDCLLGPFEYNRRLIPDDPQYFTCAFNRERANQFVIKSKDTFFSSAQRSRIVWEILLRTRYDTQQRDKIGVVRLINNGTFTAAFPLHEPHQIEGDKKSTWRPLESYEGHVKFKNPSNSKEWTTDNDNTRTLLYKEWARPGCWYKRQPLNLIRKYFGDKIGIYFAWLGFYTTMLIPAAVVGLMCFLYGLITLSGSYPAKEICDEEGIGNLTICPLCDQSCPYKNLSDSCSFAKVTYLFDNPATVFFSIFMSFWATSFLEIWKRQQAKIAWEWDLGHLEEEEEPARPEFEANVRTQRTNPVTKIPEPFLPTWNRALRIVAATSAVLFMLLVVVAAVFGVIVYRIAVVTVLHGSSSDFVRDNAKITVAVSSASLNLVIILILDRIYQRIAVALTNMEQPRTQTEYEDSFTFKMFLFQSINFYSSLIYIAFFKGRFYEHPGDEKYALFGTRLDQCDPAGCLFELCVQLAIIMVGKQIMNNCMEIMFPKIQNWWRARRSQANTKQLYSRWEKDYDLEPLDNMTLFNEYLEMVIQYGFVTIFVAAFPLAPLFALLNNVVEIRLDAYKFVTQVRRPMAARANNIGAWLQILHAVSTFAVIVNAFVIAYTSGFIPRMVYQYQYSINDSYNLTGYIQNSLSEFSTADFIPNKTGPNFQIFPDQQHYNICWYRDYRNPPNHTHKYERSVQYWHVFAARLAFVVVFEHLVFFLTGLMAYIIPDVPQNVKVNVRREKLLAKEALYAAELQKLEMSGNTSMRNDEDTLDGVGYVPSHTPEPTGDSPTPPSPTGREQRI